MKPNRQCLTVIFILVLPYLSLSGERAYIVLQGDWAEINPYSKDVEAAVEYAVETFNSHSKRKRLFKLVSTTNVMNYKFDTLLAKTKCLKSENQDAESCTFKKKHVKCHFVVTFDPRTNKHSLMKHKCSKHKEHS
uniref:Cystatin domain-containing protein n=1 Tax=Gouania willdenowi TaxID=441366 RepID=A0A8C5G031_GOUWI